MHPAPVKPEISIEDLEKIDIRVGTIVAVDEVADSKKLMKLEVVKVGGSGLCGQDPEHIGTDDRADGK